MASSSPVAARSAASPSTSRTGCPSSAFRVKDGPGHIAAGREAVVGSWVHLAGVVKSDRIELYVNAKLAASAKTPGYIPSNCGQGMEIGSILSERINMPVYVDNDANVMALAESRFGAGIGSDRPDQ